MNNLSPLVRARGLALIIAAGALALAVIPAQIRADNETATLAEKAVLPLKVSFANDTSGKNEAPMIVHLKNESSQALVVKGHIDLSVVVHNRPKSREVPQQTIEAGATLTIDDLAADDKITLSAEGFAPLVVVVPYKT
jgi:hypothetical protein